MKIVKWFIGIQFLVCFIATHSLSAQGIPYTNKERIITIGEERQIGIDGASTKFSYFHTSPENPDGRKIIYLRLTKEPAGLERSALVPGELWICDYNLKSHHMVTRIKGMSSEDGCQQQWVDNNHVALLDSGVVRVIDVRNGKNILDKKVITRFMSHDSYNGNILFTLSKSQQKEAPGIYELNCFTGDIKPVLLNENCRGALLPSHLDPKKILPVEDWRFLHCQYSPNGEKICFRVDAGVAEKYQLLGICKTDGSGFNITDKPLHQMWYDNESIAGHVRFGNNGEPLSPEKKFLLMRWDLDGNYIETMGIKGNHLAISPAGDCFVSETMYNTNPVVITLTPKGQEENTIEIARFDPYDLTWNSFFHVNPAFSRDGKRIYYSRPLNEKYNGTFYREIKCE